MNEYKWYKSYGMRSSHFQHYYMTLAGESMLSLPDAIVSADFNADDWNWRNNYRWIVVWYVYNHD